MNGWPKTSEARCANLAVATENSVRSENKEVPINREIIVVTTMISLFVALFALVASSFRTRAALQAEILGLRHQLTNLRFSKRTRRVACASTAATDSCAVCCRDSGSVGGDVCRYSMTVRTAGSCGHSSDAETWNPSPPMN